jgi:hypothetical protein
MVQFAVLLVSVVCILFSTYDLCNGARQSTPELPGYLDELIKAILPDIRATFLAFFKAIASLIGFVGLLSYFIFRKWLKERRIRDNVIIDNQEILVKNQNQTYKMVHAIHHIMMTCDGCSDAVVKYGKRKEDLKVLDSEDMGSPDPLKDQPEILFTELN